MADRFFSGDEKRLTNNPSTDYAGPDDVSLTYRTLSDKEKEDMKEVKLLAQALINKIRDIKNNSGTVVVGSQEHDKLKLLDKAIDKAVESSMWAVKYICGPKY